MVTAVFGWAVLLGGCLGLRRAVRLNRAQSIAVDDDREWMFTHRVTARRKCVSEGHFYKGQAVFWDGPNAVTAASNGAVVLPPGYSVRQLRECPCGGSGLARVERGGRFHGIVCAMSNVQRKTAIQSYVAAQRERRAKRKVVEK